MKLDQDTQLGSDYGKFPHAIKALISQAKSNKIALIRVWDLCLLYLQGKQSLRYDKTLTQFVTLKNQPGKLKVIINLILNVYRVISSKLETNYPGVAVLPASPSDEDILKAKASEELLRYFYHSDNLKSKFEKAIHWLIAVGNVGLQEFFDPDLDEVVVRVISPYDFFYEPGAQNADQSSYVAIRTIARSEDVKKAFPDHADQIDANSTTNIRTGGDSNPSRRINEALEDAYYYNRVELFDVYWRDGKYGIVVGNTYLYKGRWSDTSKDIPFQHIQYTDMPDRLWGMGLVESIIDLQNMYNKARNQLIENVELMSNPKWLIPKTAGVNSGAIRGTPGEIIYYNAAGGAPTQIPGTGLPGYVLDNIARLQGEMFDVSGVHSTTLGKRAVGVTSGKAIEALAQQDISQLAMTQGNIEEGVQKALKTILQLMKKYYTKDRFVRMFDGRGGYVFRNIKATDIVDTPDIFIESGSLFRDDALSRDAKIMQLVEAEMIDKETALKQLSFRTGDTFIADRMANRNHALDMLDAVKMGAQIEIFATDDLDAFKDIFGKFIRTEEYYALGEEVADYIRDIFISVSTYQPADPNDPAENRYKYKVFPERTDPGNPEQIANQMATVSPAAQQQYMDENVQGSKLSGLYDAYRGGVKAAKSPQTFDPSVVRNRSVE
mgnify:FL=1